VKHHSRTVCRLAALGLLAVAAAQAQMGPSTARAVARPMPSLAPSGQTFNAEAEVVVSPRGRVESVEIRTSSGDPAFDRQWRKTLEDWRFVPAVDASGQPIESTTLVVYKNTGLTNRPIDAVGDAPVRNAVVESERLQRMTCRDFLWEYAIVNDSMSRRLALLDPLLKTPQVMLAAETPLTADQQAVLRERYDQVVNDAARACRDNQEGLFWSDVMKPALQAALAN
jgi:TonB family protein